MQYEVGKQWFFPQLGRKAEPGEIIELDEGVAEHYMQNEPGLLKPVRHTTQAKPSVIRKKAPTKRVRAKS